AVSVVVEVRMLMVSMTLPWATELTFTGMLAGLVVDGVLVAVGVVVAAGVAVAAAAVGDGVGVGAMVGVGVSAGEVEVVGVGVGVAVARVGLLVSGSLASTDSISLVVG